MLKQVHWLPIDERIKYRFLLLTIKALNDVAPIYIGDMLFKYAPSRRFSSSSNKLLQVPSAKLKTYGETDFPCCCAKTMELATKLDSTVLFFGKL